MAAAIKPRWICEEAHQQMKEELGLHHSGGRYWQGLHRHALMTMCQFSFRTLPRSSGVMIPDVSLSYVPPSRIAVGTFSRRPPPSLLTSTLPSNDEIFEASSRCAPEKSHYRHRCLLSTRCERPRGRSAEESNDLAPLIRSPRRRAVGDAGALRGRALWLS